MRNNIALVELMEDVRNYLGPMPAIDILPDGFYPEVRISIENTKYVKCPFWEIFLLYLVELFSNYRYHQV